MTSHGTAAAMQKAAPAPKRTSVENEILRLEHEQVANFNRRDLGAILGQFAPNFIGFSSTRHKRIAGRAALKKTFLHYLMQSPQARYEIAQPHVQILEGTAVATFYWTVELSPGRKVEGRGTHVFSDYDGHWLIVHEHFSKAR